MPDVFVSYSSQDRDRVIPLVAAIERRGWSVWWDRDIESGSAYDRAIETAIDEAKCIVVVWSENAIESDWVRNEAGEGLERDVLIPIVIDAVRPPLAFRRVQTIDFSGLSDATETLLDAIRRFSPIGSNARQDVSPGGHKSTDGLREHPAAAQTAPHHPPTPRRTSPARAEGADALQAAIRHAGRPCGGGGAWCWAVRIAAGAPPRW